MAPAISRLTGTLALAAALAGCAAAPSSAASSSTGSARPAAAAAASQAKATAQSPKQRAEADAAAILAAFAAPPGARKLPGAPNGQASELTDITGSSASPNWIDKTGFWQVKGDPQQVLAWTASHVGRPHTSSGVITNLPVQGRPETVWERDYELPPVPAVEDTRELTVETADAGGGQTAIRVDAQVTWLPARTASEMVPAAAAAVTLSEIPVPDQRQKLLPPVTITGAAAVRRITTLVSAQPVFPPGPRECGAGTGTDLVLRFLSAPGGRVLATALVSGDGCQPVIFAAGATTLTRDIRTWMAPGVVTLGVPFQGHALAVTVLKSAGLKWSLPVTSS